MVAWWDRSIGVQVSFGSSLLPPDISSQTVPVMLELKWGQQKKNYHYCLRNSIIGGVLISQMPQINPFWRYLRLHGGCIIFLVNYAWFELIFVLPATVETIPRCLPENTFTRRTFLFVFVLQFGYFYSQYLIAVSCLRWTCSYHVWTWSLWWIRLRNWIPRRVSWSLQ